MLGDLSMILCDPYAVNFLASSAIKIALHLINGDALPRENAVLVLLLRMLALGLSAWQMIDSQEFKEPKLDSQVVTKFLPALMSLMVILLFETFIEIFYSLIITVFASQYVEDPIRFQRLNLMDASV